MTSNNGPSLRNQTDRQTITKSVRQTDS